MKSHTQAEIVSNEDVQEGQKLVSICVPSRNRQKYFQQTILDLIENPRDDVEFIFADNSTDPDIMNDFMRDKVSDPRVKYLPSREKVLAMNDNWERCIEASTGTWVVFIGDDDFIDLSVADLITLITKNRGPFDVVAWDRVNYDWPQKRDGVKNIRVSLLDKVGEVDRDHLVTSNFLWSNAIVVPFAPFCFYHGAVRRSLLRKIKKKFGGRYCEHYTVDFENACKTVLVGRRFFYSQRPFSVLGSCPESNSASIGTVEQVQSRIADAIRDIGRDFDSDPHMADFPFPSALGVTAAVGQVQHWFKTKYKLKFDGWEKNFARACSDCCRMSRSEEVYEIYYAGYREAFSTWKGGAFLKYFDPEMPDYTPGEKKIFTGLRDYEIFISDDLRNFDTPRGMYDLINQFLSPIDQLSLVAPVERLAMVFTDKRV
ncbi:glycosyltransferase family 2 protein [Rhizobium sp. SG2393]|uniref:glycosyltransferase family 2 protein n=1 Tax=Rhizobium sp. SG2393 TaxID=3276279 RepID=UPI00366FB083